MRGLIALAALIIANPASAEPTGRWWAGFGQGAFEYGIKNDSAGSDSIYMFCAQDHTYISFSIGGIAPTPGQTVIVTIGSDKFELFVSNLGYFETRSRAGNATYGILWAAIRAGANMRVRLPTGQSTNFTLKGAAKVLPRAPCQTDFARTSPT